VNKRQQRKKPKGNRPRPHSSSGQRPLALHLAPGNSDAVCNHAEERELLEGVYKQVFNFMRRKAELERQQRDLDRRCLALQDDLRAAQGREDEAKVDLLKGHRAERRYHELLARIADIADEYRLSVEQATALEASPASEPLTSDRDTHRLQRLVQAPLERIEDVLSSQGVSVQQAELDVMIDVSRFDVAGVVVDAERVAGTVVHTHRPAYVRQDGTIVRKGAAVVTRRAPA
jgi:hypothetical protein